MNWRSVKFLSDDDYGKPILLRVFNGPQYILCVINDKHHIFTIGAFNGCQITISNTEQLLDGAQYIRIDEIKS